MRILFAIGFVFAAGVSAAHAEDFSCPATLDTSDQEGGTVSHKLRHVSFFDGDPAGLADLAPEEGPNPKVLDQRWLFKTSPDSKVVMVCRYHDTEETVRKDVPGDIQECRLNGFLNSQGEVLGSPTLTCR